MCIGLGLGFFTRHPACSAKWLIGVWLTVLCVATPLNAAELWGDVVAVDGRAVTIRLPAGSMLPAKDDMVELTTSAFGEELVVGWWRVHDVSADGAVLATPVDIMAEPVPGMRAVIHPARHSEAEEGGDERVREKKTTTATMQSQTIATGGAIAQFMGCSRTKVYELMRRPAAPLPVNHLGREIRLAGGLCALKKKRSNGMDVTATLDLLPALRPGRGRQYPGDRWARLFVE